MISVLVPFRGDGGQRDRLWAWCWAWWKATLGHTEHEIITHGVVNDGQFNRSASINLARRMATGDVLVIADADTVVSNVHDPLVGARSGQWSICHARERYFVLTSEGTDYLMRGDAGWPLPDPQEIQFGWRSPVTSYSGVLVMPAAAFDRVGGFDERFEGYGFEDRAFQIAVDTLWGDHWRPNGFALHLHHERGLDFASPGIAANRALCDRYYLADSHPDEMRALLAERNVR